MKSPTLTPSATTTSAAVAKRRLGATAIDAALIGMVWMVLRRTVGPGIMTFGVTFVLTVAIHAVIQGETGTTPGKSFFGLKLVNDKGRTPGTGPAMIRLAAWALDGLPCLGICGALLIWFTPEHQRIGDTITRTRVVSSTPTIEQPETLREAPGPAPLRYTGGDEEQRQDFDPIWDAKVEAYVQWDPTGKRWMKYRDDGGDWVPVESA